MTTNTDTERKIIYFEQLIAGLLLKFKKIDNLALKIIGEEISKINFVSFSYNDDFIKVYIEETSFGHKIKDEYLDENGNIRSDVITILERYSDSVVSEYLSNLSVEDLVIKRVLDLEILTPADINFRLSELEQEAINTLVSNGYLFNILGDNVTNQDYKEIVLSSTGKMRAFELTFSEYVEEFRKIVASSGYDVSLVDEFLIAQDYNKGVYEILNVDNFLGYCEIVGKSPVASGLGSA